MSKFQSTVSTVTALASIFAAGAAGFKLAQTQPDYDSKEPQPALEQKLTQLEQKLEEKVAPPPQMLPEPAPTVPTLPSTPPAPQTPPPPVEPSTEASP